jgi:hypothetical protein
VTRVGNHVQQHLMNVHNDVVREQDVGSFALHQTISVKPVVANDHLGRDLALNLYESERVEKVHYQLKPYVQVIRPEAMCHFCFILSQISSRLDRFKSFDLH